MNLLKYFHNFKLYRLFITIIRKMFNKTAFKFVAFIFELTLIKLK